MPFDSTSSVIPWSRPAPEAAALDLLGPVDGLHVLVIGPGSLEPMLALHRRGAARVTAMAAGARMRPEMADAALVPCLDDPDHVLPVIAAVRRAIRPLNSLVLVVPTHAPATVLAFTRQALAAHGFCAGRPITLAGATALVADLPLYGQLRVA